MQNKSSEEIVMYDAAQGILIDQQTYLKFAQILRNIHGLKRNAQLPANEATKRILIEDAREEYERGKDKPYISQLKNLVSAMINCPKWIFRIWN